MRKIQKLSLIMGGLILAVGAGAGLTQIRDVKGAKAATELMAYSLDTSSATGENNSYSAFGDVTYNGITWSAMGNLTMQPWRLGGKSITNTDRPVYSKTAISENITKVDIVFGTVDSATVDSLRFGVYSTAALAEAGGTPDVATFAPTFKASSTITLEKSDDTSWANCFYRLDTYITISATKNKYVQLKNLNFYYESNTTIDSIEVTNNPTKTAYQEGEALDLSGLVVKANWSDSTQTDITESATFSPANGELLAASETTVTITYSGKTTSFNISVTPSEKTTNDLYLTADILGLKTTYISEPIFNNGFVYGTTSVMKSVGNTTLQLAANTGKFWNKSTMPANISSLYVVFDSDGKNGPSNFAVKFSADTAGDGTVVQGTIVDETNRVYKYDVSSENYKYFTIARTGQYALYIDMIVVEMAHSDDDMAAVRTAANSMDAILTTACATKAGATDEQWNQLTSIYEGLTAAQKTIFDATVLNTATCNSADANNASVQLTTLQKVVSRIEYIVGTYGRVNFTGRTIETARGFTNLYTNTEGMTIVIVASALAITSAAAIAVLAVLKRKKRASK